MIGFDREIEIPGIIVVEQFSPNGKIRRKAVDFPEEVIESTAKLSADNNFLIKLQKKRRCKNRFKFYVCKWLDRLRWAEDEKVQEK